MVNTHSTIAFATLALGASSAMAEGSRFSFFARAADTAKPAAALQHQATTPSHSGVSGVLPTKTAARMAKPTACKAGEPVTWPPKNFKPAGKAGAPTHKNSPATGGASEQAKHANPALAAREPSGAHPTPAPHVPQSGADAKSGSKALVTVTRAGADGHSTVWHLGPATRTRCYGAKSTSLGASDKLNAKTSQQQPQQQQQQHALANPAGTNAAPHATGSPKLSVRARYLIARYLAEELEQLD